MADAVFREASVAIRGAEVRSGSKYPYLALAIHEEAEDGTPYDYEASCSVWCEYMWEPLKALVGQEVLTKVGIKVGEVIRKTVTPENPDGYRYQNVISVEGAHKPEDWDAQLEKKGLSAAKPKAQAEAAAGSQPSPVQTRVAIVQAVNKLAECGMVKNEAMWDAWYEKLGLLVFRAERTQIAVKP